LLPKIIDGFAQGKLVCKTGAQVAEHPDEPAHRPCPVEVAKTSFFPRAISCRSSRTGGATRNLVATANLEEIANR
jgi:hypothetical protein